MSNTAKSSRSIFSVPDILAATKRRRSLSRALEVLIRIGALQGWVIVGIAVGELDAAFELSLIDEYLPAA